MIPFPEWDRNDSEAGLAQLSTLQEGVPQRTLTLLEKMVRPVHLVCQNLSNGARVCLSVCASGSVRVHERLMANGGGISIASDDTDPRRRTLASQSGV